MAEQKRQLMTVQDVCDELQVHEETVRRWIRTGELKASLLGSARAGYRIRRSDFEQFLDEKFTDTGKAAA